MADELHAHTTSGLTLYAVLLNSIGQVWNTSGTPVFEAYNGANWTDYDIALTEAGAGIYLATMPAAAAGAYSYAVYERAGVSPATSDTLRGTGYLQWSGTAEVALSGTLSANVVQISGDSTAADNAESFFDGTGYGGANNVIPAVTTVTNGVTLADDAITSAKYDELTAFPLKSTDTGATAVARTGADSDTLETLSDQLDDVPTVTEFELRTLPAASYFDPAADVVAHVTLVDTTTTNTDMRGTDGAELTGASAAAVATLNDIDVADIIAGIAEGALDLQEILRIILAAVAGKASGGGTTSIAFRDQADTKIRIAMTVDANGNRSAVTVDGS